MAEIHKNVTVHYGGTKNVSVIFENATLRTTTAVSNRQAENETPAILREQSEEKSEEK